MTLPYDRYDKRKYPVRNVVDGYREWSSSYDSEVDDGLDLDLLETLGAIRWPEIGDAFDLGCGTGRIGSWLQRKGVSAIDGVDISQAMLDIAASKSVYDTLNRAELTATLLKSGAYDLGLCVLAACHVADLTYLYHEAARLLRPNGVFVLLDYHPFMLLNGIPTHYHTENGPRSIANFIHLFSDHVKAANQAGMKLVEMAERIADRELGRYAQLLGQPLSFVVVWKKSGRPAAVEYA